MTPSAHIRSLRARRVPDLGFGEERGTAVVEFAVVLPLLLLIVFGIMDFSRAMNYWNATTQLANEAARSLSVNRDPVSGAAPTCGSIKSYLISQAETSELKTMLDNPNTLTIALPGGPNAGTGRVEVTVTTTFSLLPYTSASTGIATKDIPARATMRLEQNAGYGAGSC